MEKITLKVEGKPDVSFTGNLVAHTDVSDSAYDKLFVFETAKGHWLLARTDMYGNLQDYTLIEDQNETALIDYLEYTDDAKSIYQQMHIDYTNKLDV